MIKLNPYFLLCVKEGDIVLQLWIHYSNHRYTIIFVDE